MKATKVLLCHHFKSQEVFTEEFEPTALTCSSSDSRVFLATKPCQVLVYTADQPPLTLLHRFQTISNVSALVYSEVGEYLATVESKEGRNSPSSARLYFNWNKCQDGKAASVVVAGYSSAENVQDHLSQFFVVQLPIRYSVTCLGCCPLTGNVVVASEARISIFRLRRLDDTRGAHLSGDENPGFHNSYCDVEHVLDVEPRFPVRKVAICESYLAFMSTLEVRVLHLLFNGEHRKYRSKWKEAVNSDQHEVIDESFVCCTFDQFATLDHASGLDGDISSSGCPLITLPSVAKEIPYLDNTGSPMEVLGPVEDVPGQPLSVRLEGLYSIGIPVDGVLPEVTARTMLYRRFKSEEMSNVGSDEDEIHTLQLLPAFAQDFETTIPSSQVNLLIPQPDPSLTLVSMCCFISGPKEGYVFDVFRETKQISIYTYSSDSISVFMNETLLYVLTSNGLEIYTSRIYASAAEWSKVLFERKVDNRLQETEINKGDCHSNSDITHFSDIKHCPDSSSSLDEKGSVTLRNSPDNAKLVVVQDDETQEEKVGEKMRQRLHCLTGKRIFKKEEKQKKVIKYFVPVYPLNQLLQPCPSPSLENILVGMKSFMGLSYIRCFADFVLVLSQQNPKKHKSSSQAAGVFGVGTFSDWTLYILKKENLCTFHKNLISLANQVFSCSSETYNQLLCEAYLQLSSQITVETEQKKQTKGLALLHECTTKFVEYYSKTGSSDAEKCLEYYKASGFTIEQLISRTFDQHGKKEAVSFGNGLVHCLDHILFTKEKKPITTSQDIANKVLMIYGTTCPAKFSQIILDSNLQGYSYDMAIDILQGLKLHYKFTPEDYLASALLYLHICEPDHAKASLAALQEGKLVSVCNKYPQLLQANGQELAPLGQLLRRHRARVLIAILLHLHDNKKMSLQTALTLLGAYKADIVNNIHVKDFLEQILSSKQKQESFDVSVKLLCTIYLLKLTDKRPVHSRPLPKLPHQHIPNLEGHFTERFRWLNKLPPFLGGNMAPERCPFLQRPSNTKSFCHSLRLIQGGVSLPSSGNSDVKLYKPQSTECACCCCHSTIIKLQSLLCSELVSKSLCDYVLSELDIMSFSGVTSIRLLCLPKIGQHHKAIQLILDNYPTLILMYAKSFFKEDLKMWSCLLDALLDRLRGDEENDNYLKAAHGTLKHLASYSSPSEFLQLLPAEGSLGFFLPYLEQCYRKWHATPLAKQASTM